MAIGFTNPNKTYNKTRAYFDKVEESTIALRKEISEQKMYGNKKIDTKQPIKETNKQPTRTLSEWEVEDYDVYRRYPSKKSEPRESNTRLVDTDWDEFFDDIPVKDSEESTIRNKIMASFSGTKYTGRIVTEKLYGEMISDAIIEYHNAVKDIVITKPPKQALVNWCEIRD